MSSPQLRAFLDMIAWSEIGPDLLAKSDDGYNVLVGSTAVHPKLFSSYAEHPRIRYHALDSDAAGRYQFMGRFWGHYKMLLGLRDFGHEAQDRWCLQLIRECRAEDDIELGRITLAIGKCRSRWASFPAAGYGQHEQKLQDLLLAFTSAGGRVAP